LSRLAERYERELIRERTTGARGRNGGPLYHDTGQASSGAAMAKRDTKVGELCKELGATRQTLYRFVDPKGELRADGSKLLERR